MGMEILQHTRRLYRVAVGSNCSVPENVREGMNRKPERREETAVSEERNERRKQERVK
jgi:hypothetical protein